MAPNDPLAQSTYGRRWWEAIEQLFPQQHHLLLEGRGIVRDGRIHDVYVFEGMVAAQFHLRSMPPSAETFAYVQPVDKAIWDRVIDLLASKAAHLSALQAGQLPDDLGAIVQAAGGALLPTAATEFSRKCLCRVHGPMCPHEAAAQYVFALNLGVQPHLLLTLRGYNSVALIQEVERRWATHQVSSAQSASEAEAEAQEGAVAPLRSDRFYYAGPELDEFSVTITPPQVEAALLRRLGSPPFVGPDEDVITPLTLVYALVTRRAQMALDRSGERSRKQAKTPG
jgi:uncharacterized Zn finger protein